MVLFKESSNKPARILKAATKNAMKLGTAQFCYIIAGLESDGCQPSALLQGGMLSKKMEGAK